jgi:antitoxin HicB
MPGLPRVTGRAVVAALRRAGWTIKRQRGSHVVLGNDGARVVVPVHAGATIPPGTLQSILDQAGLAVDEFRDLVSEQGMTTVTAEPRTYTVLLEPEPDGSAWNVRVPALPGCFTYGRTREEALARAQEAIAVYIESLEADGLPIPEDAHPPEIVRVTAALS